MSSGSLGRKLLLVRRSRGLTLEDAAFESRIPVALLREMENDDLSGFANRVYAKSFLKLYGDYLGLDLRAELEAFDWKEPGVSADLAGQRPFAPVPERYFLSVPAARPRRMGLVLCGASGVLALLAAVGLRYFEGRLARAEEMAAQRPGRVQMMAYEALVAARPGPGLPPVERDPVVAAAGSEPTVEVPAQRGGVLTFTEEGAVESEAVWPGWNLVPGLGAWEQSPEPVVEARQDPGREPGVEFPLSGIVVPVGP
jgi:cytoskeleton protein RodZ